MSNLDLNIDNYEIDDLKELLDVDENTTIGDIKSITELAVNKFNELKNQAAAIFFKEAGYKLMENFENNDEQIDDFEKEETKEDANFKFEDVESRIPPSQEVENIPKTYNNKVVPGTLNPTMRNVYNTTANIDSQYREIYTNTFDCSGSLNDDNQIIRMDSSTDYTFDLNEPLRNVLSISIGSVELPLSWYNISERMGTNRFDISGIPIVIESGFYNTIEDLIEEIQVKLDALHAGTWDISYNKRTGKTDISGATTTIDFGTFDISENCSIGPKINHNLGWLLGFRQPKYTSIPQKKLISESIADIYGPRYLFIKLGDFQNNRLTDRLTTLTNNNNTFKMPEYYKKYEVSRSYCKTSDSPHTMGFQDNKKHGVQKRDRPCRNGTGPAGPLFAEVGEIVDGLNNLTNAQKYTSQQFKIESVKRQIGQNRHFAPTDCDIILRIPIDVDMTDVNSRQKPYIYQHDGSFKRNYFGPTTIKRFKVELLDDKGINVDLNGLDWSFSLNVEKLRKY